MKKTTNTDTEQGKPSKDSYKIMQAHEESINRTFEKAKSGDAEAQFNTGNVFRDLIKIRLIINKSKGVEAYKDAKYWYTAAMKQRHFKAAAALIKLKKEYQEIEEQISADADTALFRHQAAKESNEKAFYTAISNQQKEEPKQLSETSSKKQNVKSSLQKLSLNGKPEQHSHGLSHLFENLKNQNDKCILKTKAEIAEIETQAHTLTQQKGAIYSKLEILRLSAIKLDETIKRLSSQLPKSSYVPIEATAIVSAINKYNYPISVHGAKVKVLHHKTNGHSNSIHYSIYYCQVLQPLPRGFEGCQVVMQYVSGININFPENSDWENIPEWRDIPSEAEIAKHQQATANAQALRNQEYNESQESVKHRYILVAFATCRNFLALGNIPECVSTNRPSRLS